MNKILTSSKIKINIHINSSDLRLDSNDPLLQPYFDVIAKKTSILDDCRYDKELLILRGHIAIEFFLNDIIEKYLPKGKELLSERFNFYKKLKIIESFNIVQPEALDFITTLNEIRNKCAHKLEFRISEKDIDNLGQCIPDEYSKLTGHDLEETLFNMITTILLNLAYDIYSFLKEKREIASQIHP